MKFAIVYLMGILVIISIVPAVYADFFCPVIADIA